MSVDTGSQGALRDEIGCLAPDFAPGGSNKR